MQAIERIREAVRSQLFVTVPQELEEAYREHCLGWNIRRAVNMALLVLLVQAGSIAFHLLVGGVPDTMRFFAVAAGAAYAIAMLCYLVTGSVSGERGVNLFSARATPYVFWAVLLAFELLINGVEIAIYGSEFRAYATILAMALVPLFSRRVTALYIGLFYAGIVLLLVLFGDPAGRSASHYFYWAVYSLSTAFFSLVSISSNARGFVSNQRLRESNQNLEGLNEELKELNDELETMSMSDQLTRIANRRAFDEYFQRMWAQCGQLGEPIAFLTIDIDHFAAFNNRYGHQEGDVCLQKIASALQSHLDVATTMLARYGGEEFAVLWPLPQGEKALLDAAEELRGAVESLKIPNPDSTNNPFITVSIGLASRIPQEGARPDHLVRLAMRALSAAKREGRNRAVADVDSERAAFVAPRESLVQAPGSGEDLLKLRTILTSTTIATFAADMQTGVFELSPEILEFADLPTLRFDSMEEAIRAAVYEGDWGEALANARKIAERVDDDVPAVFRLRTREGKLRWVSILSRYLPGEGAGGGEVVGSITDVDARMREQEISKLMADGAANYLFHLDLVTMQAWFNDRLCEDLSLERERAYPSFLDAMIGEDRALIEGALEDIRSGAAETLDVEVRARRPDGQIVNLYCRGLSSRDENGRAAMLGGTISDITDQVKARQINRLIVDGSSDCVYVYDIMENTLDFSSKIMTITQLPSLRFGNAIRVFLECIVPEDRDRFLISLDPIFAAQTDEYAIEMRLIGLDGHPVWVAFRGKAAFNENNEPIVIAGSILNIEGMGEYNSFLEQQSLTDRVTGLPNRISFYREINRLMRSGTQSGFIVMLDIDDFKSVNNMHGHTTGDETLTRFGDLVMAEMPERATLYHMGADLFIVNLPEAPREAAVEWMQHMRGVKASFVIEGVEIFLTFSIGAVEYHDEQTADELLSDAEIALHRAKYQGADEFVIFEPDDRADYLRRLELENALRRAVENKFEGFELYYQPLIDARTSGCVGAEALLRWRSPGGALVSPGDVIPALESTGMMPRVENWILRTAMAQCRAWIDAGADRDFIMNINLTPAQITRRELMDDVLGLLRRHALMPQNITLEITEASCVLDMQGGVHVLRDLREHGVGIAIDDFGTGYSSLSYLRQLPVSEIKIDRSFVLEVESDRSSVSFMASIIQLSRSIGHVVCVEGIENDKQRLIIRDLAADLFQGFFFSRPLPSAEFGQKYFAQRAEAGASGD